MTLAHAAPTHTAIIGAGLAGLACASALQARGQRVTVLEKSRGTGGRLATRRQTDWQCDHGAQYFTARDPRFQAQLQTWLDAGVAAEWTPRLAVFGTAPARAEAADTRRYVGVPGMTALSRHLARPLTLLQQHTVQALQRTDAGWQLRTAEHGLLPEDFDRVILAIPAQQAGTLLDTLPTAAADPALAALQALTRQAPLRACWALMAHYRQAPALPFDAAFVNQPPLRWVANNRSKPGRGGDTCWLLHADADWSQAHVEDDPAQVADALIGAFRGLVGHTRCPAPDDWQIHRWRYADNAAPLRQGCAWSPAWQLGLAGDWLHGGRVEGAWLSGHGLAAQLLSC